MKSCFYRYYKRSISSYSASIATFSITANTEFVIHNTGYVDSAHLLCMQAKLYSLDDDALGYLLEHANKGLSELHVCNNQLTVKCLDTLKSYRFRTLDLSHNAMGPALMRQLPRLLEKIPSLKQLSLECTGIGRFTEIDDAVRAIYANHGRKGNYGTRAKNDVPLTKKRIRISRCKSITGHIQQLFRLQHAHTMDPFVDTFEKNSQAGTIKHINRGKMAQF